MNYAGTFHATFPSEGSDTHSHAYTHVDSSQTHAPADAIIVPDAQLLFRADYARSGTDLILSRDHQQYVVHDYFTGGKRAPLASPDGAHLTADIVKALVGEVDVSQAGTAPAAGQVIGHVTKLAGSATVIRNGVSIILNMGDNVEKGDVVESGANSTVGITFIDGTVFGLSSNARMVLNEMVYDPNGSSNSSLMSLVAGTITFVAGETAKHGDMKIDTPVATMGIRGTAVLVEIDFSVPGQSGQPNASFQVLVEPDGTTGSYILFDKNTLQPIAIVNQAGQQININNGIINITTNPLSPDLQKLITDVFQQKFTDNSTNTKSTAPSTDSIIPTSSPLIIKTADATITAQTVNVQTGSTQPPPPIQNGSTFHISGPPIIHIGNLLGVETSSFLASGEQAGLTGSPLPDGAVGIVSFNDINVGDRPSVTTAFDSFTYKNAHGQNVTGGLSALQLADIAATEVNLTIVPGAHNTNVGSAFFIYSIADQAFDFLAAGEQITLTYLITVNENYAPDPTAKITVPITITITGTNDAPVITTSAQSIAFTPSGTKTVGGDLQTKNATSGTMAFTDVDLTDTHTVATKLTSAVMSNGGTVPPLPDSVFEAALSAAIGVDSTGTGAGTINWQLAPLPVYLSDFIPPGQTLTLTYTITVTDSQGAISTQTVTVTITGNENPAVVWIHTTTDGHDNLWTTANNWETGTVPTSSDDVIIITDQLHPNTPAYPVTIDGTTKAAANSVTMNDFVSLPPELDVLKGGSLAIVDALSMSADSILHNAGTVSVGGKIELLDSVDDKAQFLALNHSVLVNSGTLNLAKGGDFQGLASVTNTGFIDLQGGVLNVLVDIANTGTAGGKVVGGQITVEGGATLALGTDGNKGGGDGGITGGSMTIVGELDLQGSNFVDSGTLSNSGHVFVTGLGNSFDAETITNTGAIELKSGAALAIDQGSSVSGSGTITIDGTATLTLDDAIIDRNQVSNGGAIDIKDAVTLKDKASFTNSASTNAETVESLASLTLNDASVSGGIVTNKGTLNLQDGSTVSSGALDNSAGNIYVSGSNNALHDETITNEALEVLAGAVLTIDLGSSVDNSNGTVTVDRDAIHGDATLNLNNASITGGNVVNSGIINSTGGGFINSADITNSGTIESTASTLTIDPATPHTLTNLGTVEANGGELDITTESVTNKNILQAIDSSTLKLSSTTVANTGGTVSDASGSTIELINATISGGTVTLDGTLSASGTSALHGATINVDAGGVLESTAGGTLTIDTSAAATLTNSGTVEANGGELDITTESVTNKNILQAIDSSTLKLSSTTVANTGGTVSDASGSTIDLINATISGGTITLDGTLNAAGTSAIHGATINVDASGVLESTAGGTLTVDTSAPATLTNFGTVEANGGELDITTEAVTNKNTLQAVGGGKLKLNSTTVTSTGSVTVDQTSELDLASASILGGSLSNAGTLDSLSGSNTISAVVSNTGTTEVKSGTLDLAGGVTGGGHLIVDEGATLELAGADAETVTLQGGAGAATLQLDSTAVPFNGTITVNATGGGTFNVNGQGSITASSGDGLDVNASGTSGAPANVTVNLSGAIKGAANGIVVTQNGYGSLTVDTTGAVTGNGAGDSGLVVQNLDALNSADINVIATGGASGDVYGINIVDDGNGNISLEVGGSITTGSNADSKYGIRVVSQGTGSETVKTDAGSSISSAGTGINAVNIDGNVGSGAQSSITVTTYGTIHSHAAANNDGSVAAGIYAGYRGVGSSSPAVPDMSVNGSVTVNNNDTLITADTGYGINAYNWGQGSITVNDGTDPTVSATEIMAGQTGIGAYANSGGTGDITINVGEHATISGGTTDGIQAFSVGTGKISVKTSATDSITGATSGIAATNADTALDGSLGSTIKVTAYGTIKSGASPNGVQTAAGILAGYSGNGDNGPSPTANGNVHGEVTVDTYAAITTQAGFGIDAFNWGTGDVTVIAEASSSINAADIGIGAFANDGGDVSVTQLKGGVDKGATGLSAKAAGAGTISITNNGEIDGLSGDGIFVTQAATGATGSTMITNSGLVTGVTSATTAVVVVHENTIGYATIDNSGIIGGALQGAPQVAIYEDGGNVSIDNSGTINGAMNVADGSFTNEADGVWNAAGTSGFGTSSGVAFTIDNAGIINLSSASLSGASGLTITDSGTIDAGSGTDAIHGASITVTGVLESTGGTLTLDAQSPVTNDAGGTIEASGGGTLNINGTLDNAGTIIASGGTVNIGGAVSDTGSATIASNGILHFSSDVAATQTITFQDGTGTLAVSDATDFHAAIAGFGAGDTIDLTGIALTAGEYDVWANGVLSIYSGTTLEAQLKLSGSYTQGDFALASDGHGGTEVVWSTEQASPVSGLDNAGNPVEGYSVTANLSDPSSSTGVTYTWLENGTIVGSGATFTPAAPSELNKALDVVIGFTDNGVAEQVTELAGTVAAAPAVSFGTTSPVTIVAGTALQLGGLQATFADAGSDTITATLAVADGTLAIGNEQGIGSANHAGSITLIGTLAQINAALASGVTYTPIAGFGGNDTLGFSISDTTPGHTFTGNGSLSIAVDKLTANDDAIANATPPNAAGWVLDPANGHYYRYVSASADYAAAQAGAANDGAYLATVTSGPENSFVAGLISTGATAWTAGETHNANPNGSDPQGTGNSPDTTAIWSWNAGPESGNLFTYTHWNQGEPNGGFSSTDAALQVASNGGWNDVPTTPSWNAGYVEEWGGLSGEIAFNENTGATIADSVLLANDTDSLGRSFTITAVSGKSAHGGTVVLDGNSIDYTPASNYAGADSFTYTIFDGLTTSTATVSFTIQGTQNHWNGATGDWGTAADWSFETPPVSGIDAIFDASGAYVVTITGADAAKSLTITSASTGVGIQDKTGGSLTLTGGLTIDAGSFSLIGGSLSTASIDVESAGHFIAQGSVSAPITNNGGTVQAVNTLTLSGLLTNSGTVEIDGTLQLTGGAKILGPSNAQLGAITNLGLLEILGAATLLDASVANAGHNIQVDGGQTLHFDNSTINSGTLTVTGELDSTGTSAINNATIVNQNNIHVISGTLTIDPTKVTNTGTILVDSGTKLDLQGSEIDGGKVTIYGELDSTGNSTISGATILNDGVIDIKSGTLTIDATSVLSGTGGFKLDGGSLALKGALSGNIDISGAATVELESSSSTAYCSATVIFDQGSTGTLKLDFAEHFGGKVSGFTIGQTLDLADVAYSSKPIAVYTGDASGGVLAVYVNGHDVANIDLTGDYRNVQWALSSDGQGGTDIRESTEGVLAATLDHSTAQQGVTMHVTGVTDGGHAVSTGLSYAWQMSADGQTWTTVGNSSSFTPGEPQEGHFMQLVVTYTDAAGTQDVVYALGMPNDLAVTVDQTAAQQGLPIDVTSVTDAGTAVSSGVTYLWETSTDGQTWTQVGHSSSYTPSFTNDGGKLLQLVVSYTDSGESESVTQSFGAVAPAKEWTGGNHSWETGTAWSSAGSPGSNDNAVVDANGHYTVLIDQSSATAHSLVENASQATVEIFIGGKLTLGGNLDIDQGHFQVDFGGTLKDVAGSAIISGAFTNNGTVEVGGGKLEITDAVSGLGSFKVDSGATLQLDHASSENVTFSGQGTLALEDPTHFTGLISDSTGSLTDKDVLDLAGFDTKASVSYVGGTSFGELFVSENGKLASIAVGANTTHWTKPVSDGHGGILIEDPVVNDATPPSNANHPWSTAGADGFVFKSNPGANAAFDPNHSPAWLEPGSPDSTAKVAQVVQNHEAAELPNLQALHDALTPDSLKAQLLLHHNEFHFV